MNIQIKSTRLGNFEIKIATSRIGPHERYPKEKREEEVTLYRAYARTLDDAYRFTKQAIERLNHRTGE